MTPTPNPVRQDLVRGLRWGTILLLAVLLTIAGFRLWSSNEAVAREPAPGPEPTSSPAAVEPLANPEPVLEVGAPPAPAPRTERPTEWIKSTAKAPEVKAEKKKAPKEFVPAPRPVDMTPVPLPEVTVAPEPVNVVVPSTVTPPPPDDPTIGSRARGVVRSVGRFFRLGRKNDEKAEEKK